MILDLKTMLFGDLVLLPLDGVIDKLLDLATLAAHDMVVVRPPVQFEDGLPPLEMMALDQTCIHELGKNPIHRRQADLFVSLQQGFIHILRGHVMDILLFQDMQDLDPGKCHFQARFFDICIFHAVLRRYPAHVIRVRIRYDPLLTHYLANDNQLRMRKLLILTLAITMAGMLGACSSIGEGARSLGSVTDAIPRALDKAPLIYRPTIQQGNVVTQEQVNKLKPGMSRRQVQFILGSPTLQDAFHRNRWDYPYTMGVGSTPKEYKYLSVFFKDDRLTRISGDLHPLPPEQQKPVEKPAVVKVPDWHPEAESLIGKALSSVGLDDDIEGE